jgi:hypothetical protein
MITQIYIFFYINMNFIILHTVWLWQNELNGTLITIMCTKVVGLSKKTRSVVSFSIPSIIDFRDFGKCTID